MKVITAAVSSAALLAVSIATPDASSAYNATRSLKGSVAAADGCGPIVMKLDFPGYDIGSSRQARFHYCIVLCAQNPNCTAWTWSDHESGTCWFKSGHGNAVYNDHATSGVLQACDSPPSAQYLVAENCDMRGNDDESRPGRSYQDCAAYGLPKPFTWSDYNGGTCWFKTAKAPCEYAPNKFSGMLSDF